MLNLSRLRSESINRVRNNAITPAQWNLWANYAQNDVGRIGRLGHLYYKDRLVTVALQRTYYSSVFLPNCITAVADVTNDLPLTQKDDDSLITWDPDINDTGTCYYYSLTALRTIRGQPGTASTIRIVSTDAADITQKVRIRGKVNGALDDELLSLNGTTDVDGVKLFSEVMQISKDVATNGKVTVTDVTGGTILSEIARYDEATEYQEINFWRIPAAVYNLDVYGYRYPMKMINDEDLPELPDVFHELLVTGMQQRAHQHLYDYARAKELKGLFEFEVEQLAKANSRKLDKITRIRGRRKQEKLNIWRISSQYDHRES